MLSKLNFHAVARHQPDPIPSCRSGAMRQNLRFVAQLEPVQQARQFFHNDGLNRPGHGRVNTHGPLAVTATQCSK
jgi:hypothetical protein